MVCLRSCRLNRLQITSRLDSKVTSELTMKSDHLANFYYNMCAVDTLGIGLQSVNFIYSNFSLSVVCSN